jgi:hypothetical protein
MFSLPDFSDNQVSERFEHMYTKRREFVYEIAKQKREKTLEQLRELLFQTALNQTSSKSLGTEDDDSDKEFDMNSASTINFNQLSINKPDSTLSSDSSTSERNRSPNYFGRHYTIPEYMLSLPPEFGPEWMIIAKPKGLRCFVTTGNGRTISRDFRGHKLKTYKSLLPGGSSSGDQGDTCVLDCIYDKINNVTFIMDVVVWEKKIVADWAAFDRMGLIDQILGIQGIQEISDNNKCVFKTPLKYNCDLSGFIECYSSNISYLKDGLYFMLKAGNYIIGQNPYLLWWKDKNSQIMPDKPNDQYTLRVNEFQQIVTKDNKPIYGLNEEESNKLPAKTVVKVRIKQIKINENQDTLEGMFSFPEVEFVEIVSKKVRVDRIERIMYDFFGTCVTLNYDAIFAALKKLEIFSQ